MEINRQRGVLDSVRCVKPAQTPVTLTPQKSKVKEAGPVQAPSSSYHAAAASMCPQHCCTAFHTMPLHYPPAPNYTAHPLANGPSYTTQSSAPHSAEHQHCRAI